MHGHTRTGSGGRSSGGRRWAKTPGDKKINTRAHARAQPPIDARNHPGDNGRGFIVLRLIHTLLSSPSHNHTIKVEVGGGRVEGG